MSQQKLTSKKQPDSAAELIDIIGKALSQNNSDSIIQYLVTEISIRLAAKHSYIFADNPNIHFLENICEWNAPRTKTVKEHLLKAQMFYFGFWHARLMDKKNIIIDNISSLHKDYPIDYELLKSQNIKTLVILPICIDNKLAGFWKIDNPDINLVYTVEPYLNSICSILGSMLKLHRKFSHLQHDSMITTLISMSKIYNSMHIFDLEHDTFQHIIHRQVITNIADDKVNNSLSKHIGPVMKYMTAEADVEKMLAFTDLKTLSDRMKGKYTITEEFRGNFAGWSRARFIRMNTEPHEPLKSVIFAVMSINEEKTKEEHLTHLAETDIMTGLLNRGSGEAKISALLKSGQTGMFSLFDLNKFKTINDTYGHDAGDKVIRLVADILRNAFRRDDIILRLGGDEFAAFALNVNDIAVGADIISRCCREMEKINLPELHDFKPSFSLGNVFAKSDEVTSFEELYRQADKLLYQCKNSNNCTSCRTLFSN